MPKVVYAPEADDDLVDIADCIARDKPDAARQWIRKIRETCETLASNPEMGQLREDLGVTGCRSFSVSNYVVFFRASNDGIEVSRVVHGSRDMRNL